LIPGTRLAGEASNNFPPNTPIFRQKYFLFKTKKSWLHPETINNLIINSLQLQKP
jgi:hypothetical protein